MDEVAAASGDVVMVSALVAVSGAVVLLAGRSVCVQPLQALGASGHHVHRAQAGSAIGAWVRRRTGQRFAPEQDYLAGRLLVAAAVTAVILPVALVPLGILAVVMVRMTHRRRSAQRDRAVAFELPGFVDLYAVGVHAGLGSSAIIDVIVGRIGGVVTAELGEVVRLHQLGRSWPELVPEIIDRLGALSRPFAEALEAYETSGVAIGDSLAEISQSLRDDQRRDAETAARRLPVQMLFPLIVCVLPAFLLLTVAPIVVEAFSTLRQ